MEVRIDCDGLTYDTNNKYDINNNDKQDNIISGSSWEKFPSLEKYRTLKKEEKILLWKRARVITEDCIAKGIDLFKI